MAEQRARGGQQGNGNATKHGLYSLQRRVKEAGLKAIDGRSAVGRALMQWRASLVADLGGETSVSTQESALVDLAVKGKLLLDSIDTWLLIQPSLVNARKKSLLPVVRERQQLADGLLKTLVALGLERRARPVPTLRELLGQDGSQVAPHGETQTEAP